jgi:TonB family protein
MLEKQLAQGVLTVTAVAVLACAMLALFSVAFDFGKQEYKAGAAVTGFIDPNRLSTRAKSAHVAKPILTTDAASNQIDPNFTSSTPLQAQSAKTRYAIEPQLSLREGNVNTTVGSPSTLASNIEAVLAGTALNAESEALAGNTVEAEADARVDVAEKATTPLQNSSITVLPAPMPRVIEATPRLKVTREVLRPSKPSKSHNKTSTKAMMIGHSKRPSSITQPPGNRLGPSGYQAKIWSALARKKPKTGERGSTIVVFGIGVTGALSFVRVGRSSGNSRLDQLALATVRNAAPYPAPSAGPESYSIRIDFH